MSFKIEKITEESLPVIATWLKDEAWNLPPAEKGLNTVGYFCSEEGEAICCLYLYTTGTGYAFIDWFAKNPLVDENKVKDSAKFLLDNIGSALSHSGIHCAAFYTRSEYLVSLFKTAGYRAKRRFVQLTKLLEKEEHESHHVQPGTSL